MCKGAVGDVDYIHFGKGEWVEHGSRAIHFGAIFYISELNGYTNIRVKISNGEPNHALRWWEQLEGELLRYGLIDEQPTSNQPATIQEPPAQSPTKRMISAFTSRFDWRYMLLGLFLSVVVLAASLIVYPASSQSGGTLLALIVAEIIGVISVIAIFRQAFEITSVKESDKTKLQKP